MLALNLTKDEMIFLSDISRSIIPLFAAMTGAYLTYRFSKRDKIRDHLFSYKVKSYTAIVEHLTSLEMKLRSYKMPTDPDTYENEEETLKTYYANFSKILSEQGLFMSTPVKFSLYHIQGSLLNAYGKEVDKLSDIERGTHLTPYSELADSSKEVLKRSAFAIKKIRDELGFTKLNTTPIMRWRKFKSRLKRLYKNPRP